jgi:predicted nucleotidyltransferase
MPEKLQKSFNLPEMLLRNKDKLRLLDIFSAIEEPVEIMVFGSRIGENAHSGSDLDLVIRSLGEKSIEPSVMLELSNKIRESNIPILVDLFEWSELPESFKRNIMARHEILYRSFPVTSKK